MVCAVLGLYTLPSVGTGVFRVEAVSNTSTVALRVAEDDKKGNPKSETVKYDHESHGTWTRE
jgi:hypothetical protein